jgi:hypothetical protein
MPLNAVHRRRLDICLSGLSKMTKGWPEIQPGGGVVICGALEGKAHIRARHADSYWRDGFRGSYKNYIRPAQRMFACADTRAVFAIYPVDSRSRFDFPVVMKTRLLADRAAPCVILPLDHARHWGDLPEVARHDIPFRQKEDRMIWRGVTTGVFKAWPGVAHSSRFFVASLRPTHPGIDIAYSAICQIDDGTTDVPLEIIRAGLRPPLSLAEQLRAKFLVSLEGNDVASGLKWMLYSNSAVVMPPPTCESWACEGDLVPYEHYIPLKPDLSDVDEVFDWCLSNPDRAEEIAANGRRFIEGFMDPAGEAELCREIVSAYLGATRYRLNFDPAERLAQALRRPFIRVGTMRG